MDYSGHVKESVIDMLMFNALKMDATIGDKHAALGFWNWVLKTYFFRHHSYNIMINAPNLPSGQNTPRMDFAIQMLPDVLSERNTDYLVMGMGCSSFAAAKDVAAMEEKIQNQAAVYIDAMREPSMWLMTFMGSKVRLWAYQKYKLVPLFPNDHEPLKVDGYFDAESNRPALQSAFNFIKRVEPRIYIREFEALAKLSFQEKLNKIYTKLASSPERSTENNRMKLINSAVAYATQGEGSTSKIAYK